MPRFFVTSGPPDANEIADAKAYDATTHDAAAVAWCYAEDDGSIASGNTASMYVLQEGDPFTAARKVTVTGETKVSFKVVRR